MATKKASKSPATRKPKAAQPAAEPTRTAARPSAAPKPASAARKTSAPAFGKTSAPAFRKMSAPAFAMPDPAQFTKFAKMMTPEQAFELYKANAKMALDIIEAAVESTAKMRKLQYEGEEQARSMQKKVVRNAAAAGDAQSLMAAGQSATQEAVQHAMQYWGEMFELIVDMQKRLFAVIEGQMSGVPGVKEAKAAMAMMPDMAPAKDLIEAMRGVMTSGGTAFESMQRVMGDFGKIARDSMPGTKR
jgi:phasin family protein